MTLSSNNNKGIKTGQEQELEPQNLHGGSRLSSDCHVPLLLQMCPHMQIKLKKKTKKLNRDWNMLSVHGLSDN